MPQPSPPKPRAALRVAVVGHRRDKLPIDADESVRAAIGEALDRIATTVAGHLEAWPELYRPEPPLLTVYTGLAEGADRLAAEVVQERPVWRMHAVLPFRVGDYEHDFEAPVAREPDSLARFRDLLGRAARVTVLDGVAGRYDAFEPLGRTVVEAADIVVAVWDGRDPTGPGGTGNVVRLARSHDLPVIRIDPVQSGGGWLEQPGAPDEGRADGLARLGARVSGLLAPPADPTPARRWFAERGGPRGLPRLFDRVVAMIGGYGGGLRQRLEPPRPQALPADPGARRHATWTTAWPELPPSIVAQAADSFAAQLGWADDLARWFAARFRASFTAIYLLAVAAVLVGGLLELEPPAGWRIPDFLFSLAEPALLAAMLVAVRRGRGAALHQRWLDYRSLAERTRHMATLWVVARTPPLVRVPPVRVAADPRFGWIGWLLRATAREAGLVTGTLDREHAASARRLIRRIEATEQQQFHLDRRKRFGSLSAPLEHLAEVLVMVALAFALLRFAGFPHWFGGLVGGGAEGGVEERVWSILAIFALALPAMAAGVHGFLGTADFDGTVLRSAEIEGRLAQLSDRLDRLEPVDLAGVGEIALEMTTAMEGELGSWHAAAAARSLQAG